MQMRLNPRIIADSNILSGKPVIEGTTTPASALIVAVASGQSFADVAKAFGVSDEDVRAALEIWRRARE